MSSEEEDDYMSDAFLAKAVEDVRPGLVTNRITQRQIEVETRKHRVDEEHRSSQKPLHVVERERREEGLSQAIPTDNKGFAMLAKLGYKAGDTLGRPSSTTATTAEPIKIEVKADRVGLGKRTADEDKLKKIRARTEVDWSQITDGFRQRVNQKRVAKELSSTFYKYQKICEQFDASNGIEVPEKEWFWPPKIVGDLPESSDDDNEPLEEYETDSSENSESEKSGADDPDSEDSNSDDANRPEYDRPRKKLRLKIKPKRPEPAADPEFTLEQQVDTLMNHMRTKYFYCLWCGVQYKDSDDLNEACPGPTKDLH